MADIAKLVARLELQSSQFQTELEKTNKKILGFQRQTTASLSKIERSAKEFSRIMTGAIAGIGFGALATGIRNAVSQGDELLRLSKRMGTTVESLSALQYVAKQSDVEFRTLSSSLDTMAKNLGMAADDGGRAKKAIAELGLDAKKLAGLTLDSQLESIADAMASVTNPTQRTMIAMQLFGSAGADLIPVLAGGSAGIRTLKEEAKALGFVLNDSAAKDLAAADEAIKKLTSSYDAFWRTVAVGTVGVAEFLGIMKADDLAATAKEFDSLVERRAEILKRMRALDGKGFSAGFKEAEMEMLKKNLAFIEGKMASINDKRMAMQRQSAPAPNSPAAAITGFDGDANLDAVKTTALRFDEFQRQLQDKRALREYIDNLQEAYRSQSALFEASDKGISESIGQTMDMIGDGLDEITIKSEETFNGMSEFAKAGAANMQGHFADFLFDPFSNGVKGMLKGFVDTIRRMAAEAAAARVFESLFGKNDGKGGGAAGMLGGFLSSMFGGARANGGPVSAGKAYLVGERGPEMFMPGSSGSIAPNGMGSVSIVNNIDARGATHDAIAALPEILKRNNETVKAEIVDGLRRKKFAI
jgi:hypothetical protein